MAMPVFEPTDRDRVMVEKLAGHGFEHNEICEFIINTRTQKPITPKTLRKVFRRELDVGVIKAAFTVSDTLYGQAVGAPAVYDEQGNEIRAEVKPIFQCTMFWLKCRRGWKETSAHELTGKEGGPIPIIINKNEVNF